MRKQRMLPHSGMYCDHIEKLKSVASFYGYSTDDIEDLLADGFFCEEIEEMLWSPYGNSNSDKGWILADYKTICIKLFNAVTDAINILQAAQIEKMY